MNLAALTGPWAITPTGAKASAAAFKKMMAMPSPSHLDKRPKQDYYGQPIEQARMENGVAIVPLKGTMLNATEPIYKLFGFVSHQDVADDLKSAAASKPKGIVLDIDSPGGSAIGTPELSALVAEICRGGTTIIAHTSNVMASAAMYTAAGATLVTSTGSAIVGCIGSIMEHVDTSRFWADMGVDVQLFVSGKYKGMGTQEVPLTDDQKSFLQAFVDESANAFKDFVLQYRPDCSTDDMEGQFFTGNIAQEKGLVDFCVPDFSAVLAMFN